MGEGQPAVQPLQALDPNTRAETQAILELILKQNENIQVLTKKFEGYQDAVNRQFVNLNAKVMLLENDIKRLKS